MDYLGYIVIGLTIFMLLFQFLAWRSARQMIGRKAPSYDQAPRYDKTPAVEAVELYYFFSPGCAACRPMTPIMETLTAEQGGVHLVDIAQDPQTAMDFNVRGTPCLVKVNGGIVTDVQLGTKTEKQIRALLGIAPDS